jgi:hypothetical protein
VLGSGLDPPTDGIRAGCFPLADPRPMGAMTPSRMPATIPEGAEFLAGRFAPKWSRLVTISHINPAGDERMVGVAASTTPPPQTRCLLSAMVLPWARYSLHGSVSGAAREAVT